MSGKQSWAIVGGGLLGMRTAELLARAGGDVTLFEAADHLGGLADAWQLGDVQWDRHYHVTLLSDLELRSLLQELDLQQQIRWVETKTGFFTDGRLHSMSNTVEFLKFPPLGLIDKLRLGGTIFLGSRLKNWRKLEGVLVEDWLRRWSGKRTTEKIWLPLLRAKLGENYRETSAAFIWATIARMYAARRSGLKKEMFGYVSGGYGRVIDAYEQRLGDLGVRIRTGSPVQQAVPRDGGVVVNLPESEEDFDSVVLTVPSPLISRMCPDLSEEEHTRHTGIRYQGIVCASVLLKEPLSPYYVTNITDDWVPFTAVIEMSALVDRSELGGRALVYLPRYADPSDPVFETSDEQLRESFVSALQRMYPHFRPEHVEAFRVSRVRHVVGLSTLDYSTQLPPMRTSLPGIYAVNSAQIVNGTLNVNETLCLAKRAFREMLQPAMTSKAAQGTKDVVEADCQPVAGS